jgi:hypothetical protein
MDIHFKDKTEDMKLSWQLSTGVISNWAPKLVEAFY